MRTFLLSSVALGALVTSSPAWADDSINTATAGLVLSIPLAGSLDQWGLGVNASVMHYPDDDRYLGYGGFAQAQYLFGGGWRVSAGFQPAAWAAGAELGLSVVSARGRPVEAALHLAPYLSIGYATAGVRYTVPFGGRGFGLDLFVDANVWFMFKGDRVYPPYFIRQLEAVPGRPLVVDGRARVALVADGPAWRDERETPVVDALTDEDRLALADAWTRAMLDEHASIAAFARASLQLMAVGAPPELLARVHRAALDEVDHARRCATLARRFAGRDVAPGALVDACAPVPLLDLAALAVATLREGCLGEGVAARLASRSLSKARDPMVREALAVIARDEAEHGALAWDVVAWCAARGGETVRAAVIEALREAPQRVGAARDAAPHLEGLGLATARSQRAAYAHERRAVMRRWSRLAKAA